MGRKRATAALLAALALAGCSSDDTRTEAAEPAATPPPATVTTPAVPAPAAEPDRTKAVHEAYYRHCKEFTWQALVFPRTAKSREDAASQYAGPPRQYRNAAYDGCLAGLRADEGRITVADVKRALAEEAAEHGGGEG